MRLKLGSSLLAIALLTACGAPASPLEVTPVFRDELTLGVNATVVWQGIEGGFWAVRMDGGQLLDPHESLPARFRVNNMRVRVEAQVLDNVPCFHMVGPRVSITSISGR